MTQDCWAILEIEPTQNVRDVKRAYAKKVKQVRPDDDPEGFKVLYNAYQAATYWAQHPEEDFELLSSEDQGVAQMPMVGIEQTTQPDRASATEPPAGAEIADDTIAKQEAVAECLDQVQALMRDQSRANRSKSWQFLEANKLILEGDFREALGIAILRELADYNMGLTGKKRSYNQTPRHVFAYLNSIFFWSAQPYILWAELSEEQYEEVIPRISRPATRQNDLNVLGGASVVEQPAIVSSEPSQSIGSGCFWVFIALFVIGNLLQLLGRL